MKQEKYDSIQLLSQGKLKLDSIANIISQAMQDILSNEFYKVLQEVGKRNQGKTKAR